MSETAQTTKPSQNAVTLLVMAALSGHAPKLLKKAYECMGNPMFATDGAIREAIEGMTWETLNEAGIKQAATK